MHKLHYYVIKSKDDLYVANRTHPCLGKTKTKNVSTKKLTAPSGIVRTRKKSLKVRKETERSTKRNGENLKLTYRVKDVASVIQL